MVRTLETDIHDRAAVQLFEKFEPFFCGLILIHITLTGKVAAMFAFEIAHVGYLKIYGFGGFHEIHDNGSFQLGISRIFAITPGNITTPVTVGL